MAGLRSQSRYLRLAVESIDTHTSNEFTFILNMFNLIMVFLWLFIYTNSFLISLLMVMVKWLTRTALVCDINPRCSWTDNIMECNFCECPVYWWLLQLGLIVLLLPYRVNKMEIGGYTSAMIVTILSQLDTGRRASLIAWQTMQVVYFWVVIPNLVPEMLVLRWAMDNGLVKIQQLFEMSNMLTLMDKAINLLLGLLVLLL